MKRLLLVLVSLGCMLAAVLAGQDRDGNFDIRFEPTAKLQSGVEVPFQISVNDPRHKPVEHATVTLRIEDKDMLAVKDFKTIMTGPGMYLAKPTFPSGGEWSVYVEVRRDQELSSRTIQFQVAE